MIKERLLIFTTVLFYLYFGFTSWIKHFKSRPWDWWTSCIKISVLNLITDHKLHRQLFRFPGNNALKLVCVINLISKHFINQHNFHMIPLCSWREINHVNNLFCLRLKWLYLVAWKSTRGLRLFSTKVNQ